MSGSQKNTRFLSLNDLYEITKGLKRGDKDSIETILIELDRLTNIVKDYESKIELLVNLYNQKK